MIQGFGEEETEELSIFSLYIGVDFVKIGASVIIMSTIGAITDTAIAISSPMREMFHHHPFISRKELFTFGLNIGKDILGTSTNTLFFAFFGGYMALLIWFKDLKHHFYIRGVFLFRLERRIKFNALEILDLVLQESLSFGDNPEW